MLGSANGRGPRRWIVLVIIGMVVLNLVLPVNTEQRSLTLPGIGEANAGCECCEYWPEDWTGVCPTWSCVDSNDPPTNTWCYQKISQVRLKFRICRDIYSYICYLNQGWSCITFNAYYYTYCDNTSGTFCYNKSLPDPGNPYTFDMQGCKGNGTTVLWCLPL